MSDISPIQTSRAVAIDLPRASDLRRDDEGAGRAASGEDSVELSESALFLNLLSRLRDLPEVRADVVERAKAEYAGDDAVTDEKLDHALSSLVDDLAIFG